MKKSSLSIIIPSRNEEEVILATLKSLKEKVKIPHEIIIVDDSSDKTPKLVNKYIKTHKNVKIISGKPNTVSFSKAIKIGMKEAKTDFAVVVMADLCDDPKTINRMHKKMGEGWDIVCGSRYAKGGKKKGGPFVQSFFSFLVCISLHYLVGVKTKDVSNAFKMYRKEIIDKIVIGPSNGVETSMIMTLQAHFKDMKITEIPTSWKGRTKGKSKFKILNRTPKYSHIYFWAIKNTVRKYLRQAPLKYSIKY